ncbi:MAG: DEAD/DEAH box helicase family protein [Rikenellaceae bacterium]|nr:DEAD/DEAH box helicase family protein [Rikenellaceae bacterium]
MDFKLTSQYSPTGDQPEAINGLIRSIRDEHSRHTTLLGVTGSGKTFTMANVIAALNRPTLVLSHNKTLAGQLYNEFKSFFPENAVEFFVSYYDYYQPEAYLPQSDTYIEKDLAINEEIEKLRLSTASTLLSGRRDVVVVSSVSCLYGIGNPSDFHENTIEIKSGQLFGRQRFLQKMTTALYNRDELDFKPGTFKVKGDTIDIHPAYSDTIYRVVFNGERIEGIFIIESRTGMRKEALESLTLYPASNFVTSPERLHSAIEEIQDDLFDRIEYFNAIGKPIEANRLKSRVEYDLEMIKEVGYCSGIENYSRYFDGRSAGSRPFCLLD